MGTLQDYLRYLRIESGDLVTPICPTKSFIPGQSYPVEKIGEGEGNVIYLAGQPVNRDKFEKIQWRENPWRPNQTSEINLTPSEQHISNLVAELRNGENVKLGIRGKFGGRANGVEENLIGVPAEMAVAKYLGLYWEPEFKKKQPVDIKPDIQVRASVTLNARLLLHDEDRDTDKFVWVIKQGNTYTAKGWILCSEGKRLTRLTDPSGDDRPAYFVANEKLWPMELLKGEL
jgi:hypothetical protein